MNVRASALDERRWFAPFVETFTSEGWPWARTGAVHSYERFPDMSDYERLLADFAARGARP